jgi:hypothetical protein
MADQTRAEVWIADDGELADVRKLLERLGVAYASVPRTGDDADEDTGPVPAPHLSCSLLFTSPPSAVTLQPTIQRSGALHVVVIDEVSRTLRSMLERSRCDFVLQRPIHPGVLRLLVAHSLYTGPEKRRARRVLIGEPVTFKSGLLPRNATLIELSESGCSLATKQLVDADASIQLTLPRKLTGAKALVIEGRTVSRAPIPGQKSSHRISVAFVSAASVRRELRAVLRMHARGSAMLRAEAGAGGALKLDPGSRRRETTQSEAAHTPQIERRRWPRKRYGERVLATSQGGARTLIGADLSRGGMRVEYDPDLAVGDELKLAIHGSGGQAPVLVRSVVVRGDDESWGIEFCDVGDRIASRLEQMLQTLPSLPSGLPDKPGLVMTEVLEDDEA